MQFTAADIFWIITGFSVPDNVIPKNMKKKRKHPMDVLNFFAGEEIWNHQFERVRQEVKIWLFKNHQFLLKWNLNNDLLKIPGLIESFFENVALKNPYIAVDPMPKEFHVSVDPWEESLTIMTNYIELAQVVRFKKRNAKN